MRLISKRFEVWDRFELSNKSFADFPLKPLGYHTGKKFVIEQVQKIKKERAGNGTRTRDFNLGKVALYQLSYSRKRYKNNFIIIVIQVLKRDTTGKYIAFENIKVNPLPELKTVTSFWSP